MMNNNEQVKNPKVFQETERTREQLILENPTNVISSHTVEGIYLYISSSCQTLLGYEEKAFIGQSAEIFCHAEDCCLIQQFYQELKQKKSIAIVTYRICHKGGYKIWVETRGKPVINPQTGKIKEILCLSRDVTKRKQIEEALIQAEREYYKIFEGSHQGIFKLTLEGCFLDVNPALAEIYGYNSPQDLLETIDDRRNQLYVNVEEYENIFNILKTHGKIINYQSQVYRKDGEILDIIENIWAVCDQWGQVIYYQGIIQEITNNTSEEKLFSSVLLEAPITHLPNLPSRKWFDKHLGKLLLKATESIKENLAIFVIHLDDFQLVNESLSGVKDDDLLSGIIKRLQSKVRVKDTLAKLAEDEFILLIKNVSCQEITLVAKRLLNILNHPFEVEKYQVFIRVYIGINFNEFKNYKKPEKMIRDAQLALHQAKTEKKENYAIFNPEIKAAALKRIQLETDLRQAIKNNQLSLNYQPIIELNTGYLSGFEVLLRWQHPNKGAISPIEFVPIAEESGLIHTIGWWVLEKACFQLQAWQDLSRKATKLVINVNVSVQQLKQKQWHEKLHQLLKMTAIKGNRLKLEITESCLLETVQNETQKLQDLKSLGLGLCIDDFGKGYSSLSRLDEFPIDTLKIDRSFISKLGMTDKAIVPMIINLAHTLGMNVVAEGIETREQFNHLQGLNCEFGQGYFFAKPMTAQEATQWVVHEAKTNV